MKVRRTTIILPEDEMRALKFEALKREMTLSAIMRSLVQMFLSGEINIKVLDGGEIKG